MASLGVVLEEALVDEKRSLTLHTKYAGFTELVMKARFAEDTLLAFLCPKDQVTHIMAFLEKACRNARLSIFYLCARRILFARKQKKAP